MQKNITRIFIDETRTGLRTGAKNPALSLFITSAFVCVRSHRTLAAGEIMKIFSSFCFVAGKRFPRAKLDEEDQTIFVCALHSRATR